VNTRRRFHRAVPDAPPEDLSVEIRDASRAAVTTSGSETIADFARLPDGRTSVVLPSGRQIAGRASLPPGGRVEIQVKGRRLHVPLADPLRELAGEAAGAGAAAAEVRARIPGRVVEIRVSAGDLVSSGETLLVLEAMKMQNEIQAESDARVAAVECQPGQAVDTGAVLVRLELRVSE
jgi:3-methylcrotonyl-CoA carboxylase alpha subunit